MAGEYSINLSNGSTLATIYPLEVNGPDSTSTARSIISSDSTGNTFSLADDMTYRFTAGFTFTVSNSTDTINDGTYTVDAGGSTYASNVTTIPVTTSVTGEPLNNGTITYTNPDSRTSLKLPGRGVVNYGELLVDNFVHLLENFAADDSPDNNTNLGATVSCQPLKGQLWYKTTSNEEGFNFFNGTDWSNHFDCDNGVLLFRDPNNTPTPNTDIVVTANQDALTTYGWSGTAESGLVVWTKDNPNASEPLYRVLSSNGNERLRVEHAGVTSTTNNIEVFSSNGGSNVSYIHGTLAIGGLPNGTITTEGGTDLNIDKTLTVQGNGIAINSTTATDAVININAPTGSESKVNFLNNNAVISDITSTSGIMTITVNGSEICSFEDSSGTITVPTGYESNVANNEDIPNKKYVDDAITTATTGTLFDQFLVSGSTQSIFTTTNVTTTAKTASTSYIMVFVDGVLRTEGAGSSEYSVTDVNEITFVTAIDIDSVVIVFKL